MDKLVITITCDSTMSFPRNPHNPKGIEALADEYVRSVNAGASICHLHGPYTVDEKIRADGTKLSDLDIPGWLRLKEGITSRVKPIIQYGIANGRFPQRVELMKQKPDMMSICFNAHDECFQPDPDYPPVELYGIHDREELENYCRLTKQHGGEAGSGVVPLRSDLERPAHDRQGHSRDAGLDNLLPGMARRMLDAFNSEGSPIHARSQTGEFQLQCERHGSPNALADHHAIYSARRTRSGGHGRLALC